MKQNNLREKSKILVEQVINGDFIEANGSLTLLILEAEEARETEINEEFGFNDVSAEGDEGAGGPAAEPTPSAPSDADAIKAVDDAIEIACQINAKIVTKIFDRISALKQRLDQAGMDQDSREYIKLDTSIMYYSDKLQDIQGKTNPAADQSKVEAALDKISISIEQLEGEIGGADTSFEEVASPEQIADANDADAVLDDDKSTEEAAPEDGNTQEPDQAEPKVDEPTADGDAPEQTDGEENLFK